MQNALFRRVRLSSPGQTWRHLTEKRILVQTPHGKVHSGLIDSRKVALCDSQIAQTAPFRYAAAPGRCGATPRQAAGHCGEWPNWANALEQPPRQTAGRVARGSADLGLSLASRKSALCPTGGFRMRLSVTSRRPGCGTTPRQPEGRVAPSSRNGDDHVCDRPRPSYASTRPLKSCGLVQTTAMRVQTPMREVPFSIAR